MIYIDSCIPMYLVGAEHPHKSRVIELIPRLLDAKEKFVTSAESFQEIIHRYKAINNNKYLNISYEALEEMVAEIYDVRKTDVDIAKTLAIQYAKLSSRDCLHVAIMKRCHLTKILTFDSGFDEVPSLQRIF